MGKKTVTLLLGSQVHDIIDKLLTVVLAIA